MTKKYKKKDIDALVDSIIVIVDTREKQCNHILKCFDKYNIKYKRQKLLSGDYSCIIPPNEEIGFEGMDLTNEIAVERKRNLEEISTNLSTKKKQFKNEFERFKGKIFIVIENNTYKDLAIYNYNTKLLPKQFLGLLHSFVYDHDSPFIFVDEEVSALLIYNLLKYYFKNKIKNTK